MNITKESLFEMKKNHYADSNKVIVNLINTIIGEGDRKSKNPSNDDYIMIMKKIKSDNTQIMRDVQEDAKKHNYESLEDSTMYDNFITAIAENEFIDTLLPKQLTIDEISTIVNNLIESYNYNLGQVMQYMSTNYKGLYNGKEVSDYVKHKLENK